MSTIAIPSALLERIRAHAADSYPEECCGVLIGRSGQDRAEVVSALPASNEREAESRHNRYLIEPRAVLEAQKQARRDGLDIVGYYHSHPDHPARPSDFDREHAWPGTSYLIVAVAAGEPREQRSWRLRDDRAGFDEEPIEATAP